MTSTNYIESSHPEFLAEQREALESQLRTAAHEIDGYRKSRNPAPSDRAWAREWPGLGSAKTWSKILRGDLEEISVEAKLPDYRGVLAALAAQRKSYAAEVLYPDLAGAQAVTLSALRMMHHHGKDRLLLIQGGSGSGKTSALDLLERDLGGAAMVRLEANEAWKSDRVAMHDFLRALGESDGSIRQLSTTGDRLEKILEILGRRGRVIVAVDEAHHCTGRILNLFKTLLNRSELLLIMAGMATLLQKLRANASEESKQLIHNRLFASVRMAGPDAAGSGQFLARRLHVGGSWKLSTLSELAEAARHGGHWSFLRRVVDHLLTAGNVDPNDDDLLNAASSAAREIA